MSHTHPEPFQQQAAEAMQALSWAVKKLIQEPDRFFPLLRAFLGTLRKLCGMDAAELFLADPNQQHLILSIHEGRNLRAFMEKAAFDFGEGYPGLVARQHTPIVTHDLPHDLRYLRAGVKALGYHTYICVPLELPYRLIGVLNLASRNPEADEQPTLHLMQQVAPVLASSLYTILTYLGEASLLASSQAMRVSQSAGLNALLEHAVRFSRASYGVITLASGERFSTLPNSKPCSTMHTCPVWQGQLAAVNTGSLQCEGQQGLTRYCLPLYNGERVAGVESLYFTRPPSPPTESMVPLLWLERLSWPMLESQPTPPETKTATPWLEVQTFGSFRVRCGGNTLSSRELPRQQAWTLLRILVAHRSRPLTQDSLCERLWPDLDSLTALNRLHGLIHALRQALEPEPKRPQVILREGDTYRFDPQVPYELDVQRFEDLTRQADQERGLNALDLYSRAITLYQGDFMEDVPYADWCELERTYLREQAIHALTRSASLLEAHTRLDEAAHTYRHALKLDPWREELYLALANVLGHLGQTYAAQEVLDHWQERLRQDESGWEA